jgi:hypothetical protein
MEEATLIVSASCLTHTFKLAELRREFSFAACG